MKTMKIEVNKNANKSRVDSTVINFISEVKSNAQNGISETEIYIAKDIYREVLKGIDKELGETKWQWAVVDSPYRNQYGQMIYPTQIDCGDSKMRKLRIL